MAKRIKVLRVALPLGIGDCHWVCQKLRSLKVMHPGRPLHVHVNTSENHQTMGYLDMMPFVDRAVKDKRAPFDIIKEMPPSYRDEKWSTLEGSARWQGFDYILVANGHLELGKRIEDYLPELQTEYNIRLDYPAGTMDRSKELMPEPTVLVYPSGWGPNMGFHKGWWTARDWCAVFIGLNTAGIEPIVVGAPTRDDRRYWAILERKLIRRGVKYKSVLGETSLPDICLLLERSLAWTGLNSGLGIVAASMGTPTVMMWADNRYKLSPHIDFDPGMHTAWLSKDQLGSYRPLSYGSPELTPGNVVASVLEVMR